ncbi:hypothetical protein B484DRAFT_440710, partial [Ochromonadaceae sp. CCMP2298]
FAGSTSALDMPEVKVRGGWTAGSVVTEQHYRRNPEGRGAFAVAEGGGEITHLQLEGLLRKPLGTCPSLSGDEEVAVDDPYDLDGEDSWVRQAGTGEDGGQEGLPGALLGAGSSSDIPAEAPPQLAGKKRVLPAAMAQAPKAAK